MRHPPAPKDRHERDDARIRIAPMMKRIREQHRTALVVRDALRDAVQPLLRHDADRREPRRVRVERVRVLVRGHDGGDRARRVREALQDVVQDARLERRERLRDGAREQEPGVDADAEGAAREEERDGRRAEDLEFAEAVWVAVGGRAPRELPADERDEVAQEVYTIRSWTIERFRWQFEVTLRMCMLTA